MAWQETTIGRWREFLDFLDKLDLGSISAPNYTFRGQGDSDWPVRHSFMRSLPPTITFDRARQIERFALQHFQDQANLHMNMIVIRDWADYMHWWAWMQHYGAPTRLVDWTISPFIAAYFAVKDVGSKDGAVWLFHNQRLGQVVAANSGGTANYPTTVSQTKAVFDNPSPSENIIFHIEMNGMSGRMVAQQGRFTICPHVLMDHGEVIDQLLSPVPRSASEDLHHKLVIRSDVKTCFLKILRSMNITANSLFPGIDGLGRSISELVRIETD